MEIYEGGTEGDGKKEGRTVMKEGKGRDGTERERKEGRKEGRKARKAGRKERRKEGRQAGRTEEGKGEGKEA